MFIKFWNDAFLRASLQPSFPSSLRRRDDNSRKGSRTRPYGRSRAWFTVNTLRTYFGNTALRVTAAVALRGNDGNCHACAGATNSTGLNLSNISNEFAPEKRAHRVQRVVKLKKLMVTLKRWFEILPSPGLAFILAIGSVVAGRSSVNPAAAAFILAVGSVVAGRSSAGRAAAFILAIGSVVAGRSSVNPAAAFILAVRAVPVSRHALGGGLHGK